jgi:hypothetical protein
MLQWSPLRLNLGGGAEGGWLTMTNNVL